MRSSASGTLELMMAVCPRRMAPWRICGCVATRRPTGRRSGSRAEGDREGGITRTIDRSAVRPREVGRWGRALSCGSTSAGSDAARLDLLHRQLHQQLHDVGAFEVVRAARPAPPVARSTRGLDPVTVTLGRGRARLGRPHRTHRRRSAPGSGGHARCQHSTARDQRRRPRAERCDLRASKNVSSSSSWRGTRAATAMNEPATSAGPGRRAHHRQRHL